jgi:hypothetical protein
MSKHKPPHKGAQPPSGLNPANAQKGSPRVVEHISTEHHVLRRPGNPPDPHIQTHAQQREHPYTMPQFPGKEKPHGMPRYGDTLGNMPLSKPVEELSSGYASIGLPSQFRFYTFKALSLRTLKASDQAKLYQAATQNNLRYTVEAISATLGNGISAFDLTPQDFYYLMYWQRVNSTLKNPMIVTASCTNAQHNEDVFLGKWDEALKKRIPLDEKTLEMRVTVNKTTLETKDLAYVPETDFKWESIEHLDLHVETMRDIVDAAENLSDIENLSETEWLAGYAAFLNRRDADDTLMKRMERIQDLTMDQVSDLDEYIKATTSYGVSESTKVKCMECGASNEVVIPFDAHTFLPKLQ